MSDETGRSENAAAEDAPRAGPDRPASADDRDDSGPGHPVRRGSVDIRLRDGSQIHHDEAFVRYEPVAFVVATDASFPTASTDRYPKETVAWLNVRHPRW